MNSRRGAFTALELLAVIGICFMLFLVVAPALSRPHRPVGVKCLNNLKNLGLAFRIYAVDNGDRLPWQGLDEKGAIRVRYEADSSLYVRGVSYELSAPKIVICPTDTRKAITTNCNQVTRENLSYFVSADAAAQFPGSFMAGDRNITNENGRLPSGLSKMSTTHAGAAGWDRTMHKEQGNACMGDGSVQQLSAARLREQLRNTEQTLSEITVSVP